MNKSFISTEIKTVIKNISKNKSPGPDDLKGEFYQISREELMYILLKLFQKIVPEVILTGSFYKANTTMRPKSDKDTTKKNRLISLINIDEKFFNKKVANRIQQHMKRIIHHDQVDLILGMQVFFNICK